MNYVDQNNRYFARSAGRYDRNTSIIKGVRQWVVEYLDPEPNDRILDIATGTGAVPLELLEHEPNAVITGIDLSEDMLQVARNKDISGKINFLQADASKLPFEDNSFDSVTTSFALHDMPLAVRDAAIREMRRVLAPSGVIVIMDYHLPKTLGWRWFSQRIITLYEELNYKEYIKKDLSEYLHAHGLKVIEKRTVLAGVGQVLLCKTL